MEIQWKYSQRAIVEPSLNLVCAARIVTENEKTQIASQSSDSGSGPTCLTSVIAVQLYVTACDSILGLAPIQMLL